MARGNIWRAGIVLLAAILGLAGPAQAAGCSDVKSASVKCEDVSIGSTALSGAVKVVTFSNITETSLDSQAFGGVQVDSINRLIISNSSLRSIQPGTFAGFSHLIELALTNDGIVDDLGDVLSSVGSLEMLSLDSNSIQNVRYNFTNLQDLKLSRNNITLGEADSISGAHINYLDLSNNRIQTLSLSHFDGMPELTDVDLSGNHIQKIEGSFSRNSAVVHLNLSRNALSSTEGLSSRTLQALDLSFNNFKAVSEESFYGMTDLMTLILDGNRLESLNNATRYLHELKKLQLADNLLLTLEPDVFVYNRMLAVLQMPGNKLRRLTAFTSPLAALYYLDVSHNDIATIDPGFASTVPHVSYLDLSFNRLKTIDNVPSSLPMLSQLDVSHNNLLSLDVNVPTMTTLNASHNQLTHIDFGTSSILITVDLASNQLETVCYEWFRFEKLEELYLQDNRLKAVACLMETCPALSLVGLTGNPLDCELLDHAAQHFIKEEISSAGRVPGSDVTAQWNTVRQEVCPGAPELVVSSAESMSQDSSEAETGTEAEAERGDYSEEDNKSDEEDNLSDRQASLQEDDPMGPSWREVEVQSQRDDFDMITDQSFSPRNAFQFPWFNVVAVLLALVIILTIVNFGMLMYSRRRRANDPYQHLGTHQPHEVYRDTTAPDETRANKNIFGEKVTEIFKYDKFSEILLNFGLWKKAEEDVEARQMINETTAPNC